MAARNNRRPVSGAVIRRRRIIAAIIALIVVIGAGLFIASKVAGSGPGEAKHVELPEDVANGDTELGSGGSELCKPEDLSVKAHTDALSYPNGEEPKLSLSIENTGQSECVADLGTEEMTFTVSNDDETVWDSTDCQEKGDKREVILEPKKPLATEALSWDRTYSDPDTCGHAERNLAETGDIAYKLDVAVAGVESKEPAQFILED